MKTYLYRASNLKSIPSLFWPLFHSGSQFLAPVKKRRFLRFIHNNNQRVWLHSLCRVGTCTVKNRVLQYPLLGC